jgi:uroporphyrinogen decarboxylase
METLPNGAQKIRDREGVAVMKKADAISIPTEVDHLLKTRADWEEHYVPRLQYSPERLRASQVNVNGQMLPFDEGGLEFLKTTANREYPVGLYCGSLIGRIRNIVGLVPLSYLSMDDPQLYQDMLDTFGDLCYTCVEQVLATGARFDYAHFWEDICYNRGPLVQPKIMRAKVGPHYKRITDLLTRYGVDIVSLDCDGKIDSLVPIWLENGVNTMFPIEVGTWDASMAPWREQYGKAVLGVGGMDKKVFAYNYAAIDGEIERLKPLVDLGGYIPCPDHRIAPDGKWANVQYYGDKMRRTFGG